MNIRETQARQLTEVYWSGTVLNIYTIGLMVIAPFWGGYMLAQGEYIVLVVLLILIAGMIGLSLIDKPLLAYDPNTKTLIAPDGEQMPLDDVAVIEIDARDVYVIPKSQGINGWHLHQKGWTLTPRRVMFNLAAKHGWPIKDITHPVSRYGFWFIP